MVEPSEIESRIRAALPDAELVQVVDLTGGKDHFQATVVSRRFGSMTRIEQHQAVYRALGDLMSGPVHALALRTLTPEAWAGLPVDEK
ncbi:MAG: BolA family transcriptional regulator [Sandaracinaceae bacterium]